MPQRLQITILSDDRAAKGLQARHGLSILLEADGRKMLFDAGQQGEALDNAKKLKIGLQQLETVVLSHGHYDHCGGLPEVLAEAGPAVVYCHRRALDERFSRSKGSPARAVGMPPRVRRTLLSLGRGRLKRACGPREVLPGIWTTGRVARRTEFESPEGCFSLDRAGRKADPIADDQGLWIEIPRGLIVVTGCAHAGIVNTVRQAMRFSVKKRLAAVIGGFHLGAADDRRLEQTAAALKKLRPGMVVACHCTGEAAEVRLARELGRAFRTGHAGLRLSF
jgi:7,8-dihydropterin-6-yl-methyl-4-(beta-D-ribofuranosyl)aminobenzene 5'-phosphate synthase